MIRSPRVPRPSRPILLTILVTALLALPMGIVLASHQFSDVPDSNPFHGDIDALVDSGVTAGCGGGRYCPKAAVTREQMAAFMNRLGALAPGRTPVVNADKVDGMDAAAFHPFNKSAPAGGTMYGGFSISGVAAGAGSFDAAYLTFPVPVAAAPTSHVITPGDPVPAGCSGSASSPRASAGHVCIFVAWELNTTGPYNIFSPVNGLPGTSRFGVLMDSASTAAGNYAVAGTWAVNGTSTLALDSEETEGTGIGQ